LGLLKFIKQAAQTAPKVDVIWACSDSIYGIIGAMLSLKYSIPLIFDLYDNFEYFLMARIPVIKQLYRWAIRKSDAITCVSRPLARLMISYGKDKDVFVLENAVKKDLFKPLDKTACLKALGLSQDLRFVGTAGALDKNRGTQSLLQAFDNLKGKYPDLHLLLAGPCNIHIPRDNRIHYLGMLPLEKVPLFLNSLDVSIICNRENDFGRCCFPQKTREIMACNIPLIAARVGSMAEFLRDHPEWLFAPDNVSDLTRVLENRLRDRRRGYKNVFSWSDIATELEEIFINLSKYQQLS
jgi:glycosyltransferase involved in cell wall biosynthesis